MFPKLLLILLLIQVFNCLSAFNLSPFPNLILNATNVHTNESSQSRSSYFGYSIVLRETSILIGAPRAQSTLPAQATINETGAIYKCLLDTNATHSTCLPYVFDDSPNVYAQYYLNAAIKDYQWLGASMDGGSHDDDKLLVCAPRFAGGYDILEETSYMHGVCFWSLDTLSDKPKKAGNWIIKPLTHAQRQTQVRDTTLYYYQLGEMGLSAHITSNGDEFIIGAPGINSWTGSAIRFNTKSGHTNIPEILNMYEGAYAGYAVASGYLDSAYPKQLLYVTTLPHGDIITQMGIAYIFDFGGDDGDTIEKYATFSGLQYGEFFGYAVLVDDVNGDGLDDILISAPYYSVDNQPDVGAVHVFINEGNLNFRRQLVASPFPKAPGRFGTSLTKLGDINLDGYKDIAISAPFAINTGTVAIFFGTSDGLNAHPSQILNFTRFHHESDSMFGFGLSKGVDVDKNGYNDLAIGAPNADTVFIYYAYPIVKIIATIHPTKARIELKEKEFQIQICYRIATNSTVIKTQELVLNIELDAKNGRIQFNDTRTVEPSHQQVINVTATLTEKCDNYSAIVTKFLDRHVFVPITLELSYKLQHDGSVHYKKDFCKQCAVVDPNFANVSRDAVSYLHGCANAVCNVDLKVRPLELPDIFILGTSRVLLVTYIIENIGEQAYDAQISIRTSLNLPLAKLPSNCVEQLNDVQLKMVCALANTRQSFTGNTTLTVALDVGNILNENNFHITAEVCSTGNEQQPNDNIINNIIRFKHSATMEIIGKPMETYYTLNQINNQTELSYNLKIQNNGPSTLSNALVRISMPIAYRSSMENRFATFTHIEHIEMNAFIDDYIVPHSTFVSLQDITTLSHEFTTLNEISDTYSLPRNRLLLLQCKDRYLELCAETNFELALFHMGHKLTIELKYKIDINSVGEIMHSAAGLEYEYLSQLIGVEVTENNGLLSDITLSNFLEPITIVNIMAAKCPIWIYVLSTIAGILLLILLIYALIKLNFFQRQTKEEIEKLLNEKEELRRMKEHVEKCNTESVDNCDQVDVVDSK